MSKPVRAGGYVLCETGWELDTRPPLPSVEHVPTTEADDPDATGEPLPTADEVLTGAENLGEVVRQELADAEPLVSLEPEHEPVKLEPAETVSFTGGYADRVACPDCGKYVAVRKDGSLRKHQCIEGDE